MPWPIIIGIGLIALLMNEASDDPKTTKKKKPRRLFNRKNINLVLQKPGVFIYYDKDYYPIYVGATANLRSIFEKRYLKVNKPAYFSYKTTKTPRVAIELQRQIVGELTEKNRHKRLKNKT